MRKTINTFLLTYKTAFSEDEKRRTLILLGFQIALICLLLATIVLVCFVNFNERLVFYLALVIGLTILLLLSLWLNIKGKYKQSAWITTITMIIGPWGSVLMDSTVSQGDFVPLMYIALSIQLCPILLSERATLAIAFLQITSLVGFLLSSPALMRENWPSMIAFVVFASTIGIVSSYANRKQLEQIEKHRNKLQQSEALLRTMAERDGLTGVFNRRYMEETLEREITRAQRKNQGVGIIMADVNDFKVINDTYGHALGDSVLRFVAEVFKTHTRGSDVVCRYGGDEFVLILPECTLEQAVDKARAFCRILNSVPFRFNGRDIGNIYLSFGVAALPEHGHTGEEILKAADKAMYEDKKDRKGRGDAPPGYHCFVPKLPDITQ